MRDKPNYIGIDKDSSGGMAPTGAIVRDARIFGIFPDSDTCAGWTAQSIDTLYDTVSATWAPCDHLASNLLPNMREPHQRIYEAIARKTRALSWSRLHDEDT